MNGLKYAFKEWAVVCRALAEGRQALILRKGGIAEATGEFRLEHTLFLLYPTYLHQQESGIRPGTEPLLKQVLAERPPEGTVRLTHWAEVAGVYHVHDVASALKLADLHLWSVETVQARFLYRAPGLYVLPVRVYRAAEAVDLPETPVYAGCRSWVELERELPADKANPVLDDRAFHAVLRTLEERLQPTAVV
jgi:hypothetical protein